jgi:hypothetical protein
METKLTIKQRISLIGILSPVASSAAKRKLINDAIGELSLSAEEIKATTYKETLVGQGMTYVYNPQNDPIKSFNFNEVILDSLSARFGELNKMEAIDGDMFPLYEMFYHPKKDDKIIPLK